jgi:hypothetical protein
MPKKTATPQPKTTPVTEAGSRPRVKIVKHSKAPAIPTSEIALVSAHEQIAKIAFGYWEARGFQPGCPEQDWLRAEREYLSKS